MAAAPWQLGFVSEKDRKNISEHPCFKHFLVLAKEALFDLDKYFKKQVSPCPSRFRVLRGSECGQLNAYPNIPPKDRLILQPMRLVVEVDDENHRVFLLLLDDHKGYENFMQILNQLGGREKSKKN